MEIDIEKLPLFLTIPQCAKMLQMTPQWLYQYRSRYNIPKAVRFGHKLRIRREEFLRWTNSELAIKPPKRIKKHV